MKPELQDHIAVIRPAGLHLVHLRIGALPLLFRAEALDALHHDAAVPGAVKDRQMSGLRDLLPETPQIMVGALDVVRRCRGADLVASGIDRFGNALDSAALAAGIPALEGQHHRKTQTVHLIVQIAHLLLQLLEFLLIFFSRQGLREVHAGQHARAERRIVFLRLCLYGLLRLRAPGLGFFLRLQLRLFVIRCLLKGQGRRGQDLRRRVVTVRGFHDGPGRVGLIRTDQQPVVGVQPLVILLVLLPVPVGDAPLRDLVRLQLPEALRLLLL